MYCRAVVCSRVLQRFASLILLQLLQRLLCFFFVFFALGLFVRFSLWNLGLGAPAIAAGENLNLPMVGSFFGRKRTSTDWEADWRFSADCRVKWNFWTWWGCFVQSWVSEPPMCSIHLDSYGRSWHEVAGMIECLYLQHFATVATNSRYGMIRKPLPSNHEQVFWLHW